MDASSVTHRPMAPVRRALVLPGGGARCAYQVGVIKALAEWLPEDAPLPFSVITGTSGGAIIGCVLATHADCFRRGAATLEQFWRDFHVDHVWRNDARAVISAGLRWAGVLLSGGGLVRPPRALFDVTPLRGVIDRHVDFARIRSALRAGLLDAVAVNASPYHAAAGLTFYEGGETMAVAQGRWRDGVRSELTAEHLMASAAVPFLFPAVRLQGRYFGDGAMRQRSPLAPAVNLGADRLLVVPVQPMATAVAEPRSEPELDEPSLGQLFGFMLESLFASGLDADLERVARDNQLIAAGSRALGLRLIDPMVLTPSVGLGDIAGRHVGVAPWALRLLLRAMGATRSAGEMLASYLLFEAAYTRDLIALGYADALGQRGRLQAFLSNDE